VIEVGEEGFVLGSEPGFYVMLRDFIDDPSRWIAYPSVAEPDLEFTLGTLEVHIESELDLPEGAQLNEEGNLKEFLVYWSDGLGVEYYCSAPIKDGVPKVVSVPAGSVKLVVFGQGVSYSIGSWPSIGSAKIVAGERTVVRL